MKVLLSSSNASFSSTSRFSLCSTQFTRGCIAHSSQVRVKCAMATVSILATCRSRAYLSHNAPGSMYRFPLGRNLAHLLHKAQDLWIEAPMQPLQSHLHFFWKHCFTWEYVIMQPHSGLPVFSKMYFPAAEQVSLVVLCCFSSVLFCKLEAEPNQHKDVSSPSWCTIRG